ncbi:MAG: helix-turn-helix transcriptional regulator [Clostridia bacterium]|nr:helix-turn-helix transcriptional regulator [Clostridia bacterium]
MQINIGEKIKKLRARDGRTQNDLATAIGVSCQAVSRWESGGGYPDLQLMPAIANYFHVTIDELFGYQGDREEKIAEILKKADLMLSNERYIRQKGSMSEKVGECVQMLRKAAEEFPCEPQILLQLARALYQWGWHKYGGKWNETSKCEDSEYNSQNIYWQEAIQTYEKLLKINPMHETAIHNAIPLYREMGEYEKAKALAYKQSGITVCRELLLPQATVGEEAERFRGECILSLLSWLDISVSLAMSYKPSGYTQEYGKRVKKAVVNLEEAIFHNEHCGHGHYGLALRYLDLAEMETEDGDIQVALTYFEKGFDHLKSYNESLEAEEYHYSAPLISKVDATILGPKTPIRIIFWKDRMQFFPESMITELRKNPKYAECFAE